LGLGCSRQKTLNRLVDRAITELELGQAVARSHQLLFEIFIQNLDSAHRNGQHTTQHRIEFAQRM
jgi:hypothetical protein